ncbi:MAG: hypothetical protein CVU24_11450 [Betaproteobacteria bacterium HGW-Betaproteobacteria-18]|nr:MAG: hypothetical protein CVU24_11450 [Betaproteobacteria bacterium HGW-Betaproteobacteria-18]
MTAGLILACAVLAINPLLARAQTASAQPVPVDTVNSTPALLKVPAPGPAPLAAPVRKASQVARNLPAPVFTNTFQSLDWVALSGPQQVALKPLAAQWKTFSDVQKRKWISISTNFNQMNADEQGKLHARMAQWAALSPRQREQARLNFAEIQKITPQQKNEKWQAYQALSPEAKQKLAESAQPKPPRTALAAKPTPPGKLLQVPVAKDAKVIGLPASSANVNNKTWRAKPTSAKTPASAAAHAKSD